MNNNQQQETLLKIVETWTPSETPQYRGFRCANCQEYKNEAWYHWVNTGGYRLPIHMCDEKCEPAFKNGTIKIDEDKIKKVDRSIFGNEYKYTPSAQKRFAEIVASWRGETPKLKAYTCDDCGGTLDMEKLPAAGDGQNQRQGWHVWWNNNGMLCELHFHRKCGAKFGIS